MTVTERVPTRPWADLLSWLEDNALWGRGQGSQMKVEDFVDDGTYVIRADLPGIDPETDLDVHVESGLLVVNGERREETQTKNRSEVRYGAFSRSLRLPAGVVADDITATYDHGVLEVRVPVNESATTSQRIAVQSKEK